MYAIDTFHLYQTFLALAALYMQILHNQFTGLVLALSFVLVLVSVCWCWFVLVRWCFGVLVCLVCLVLGVLGVLGVLVLGVLGVLGVLICCCPGVLVLVC